jgi:hypothetical protein
MSAFEAIVRALSVTKGKTESKFLVRVMALRIIDSLVLRCETLILLLGWICIGSLYLVSGINHSGTCCEMIAMLHFVRSSKATVPSSQQAGGDSIILLEQNHPDHEKQSGDDANLNP